MVGAMLAVGLLLATGVLDWRKDCLQGCPQAFDMLFWFGGEGGCLLVMCEGAGLSAGVPAGPLARFSGLEVRGGLALCVCLHLVFSCDS